MTLSAEVRVIEAGPLVRGELTHKYRAWPIAFRDALYSLAVYQHDIGECVACGGPVGYGPSVDSDEVTVWHWVTLVRVGIGGVKFLCETCAQVLSAVGLE